MCIVTSIPSTPSQKDEDLNHGGPRKRYALKRNETASTVISSSSSSFSASDTEDDEEEFDIVASFERVDKDAVLRHFLKTSLLRDFFNPSKPWVLVPNGSFQGYFDWVPERFRVGPWHPACQIYLAVLTLWVCRECYIGFVQEPFPDQFELPQAYTLQWYYNVVAFAWTSLQVYNILQTGMGWTSWGMYTIWSWTFTTLRHGLCAMAPFAPHLNGINEQLRFPMLAQATLTFGIWNAVIGPSIYAQMTTPAMKQSFCRFFGNPLWRQMHVYNILWTTINGLWGSPSRQLTQADFSVALGICLIYAYFYVLCLDRFGVHYYLVFSPRTPFALLSWTFAFGCYYACFPLWKYLLNHFA